MKKVLKCESMIDLSQFLMYIAVLINTPNQCVRSGKIKLNIMSILYLVKLGYTPGIYADGYIVFTFPFVRSYVS